MKEKQENILRSKLWNKRSGTTLQEVHHRRVPSSQMRQNTYCSAIARRAAEGKLNLLAHYAPHATRRTKAIVAPMEKIHVPVRCPHLGLVARVYASIDSTIKSQT